VRYNPRESRPAYDRHLSLWVVTGRVVLAEEFRRGGEQRTAGRFTPHLEKVYSPEEAAFLRAIYVDQSDAAPRLVYADWLDERNDPRGAVIRVVEPVRTMAPDAARRECAAHADLLTPWLAPGLWSWVLGYVREAEIVQSVGAGG
jgi:uncharacterized protein (TIGR02996 family)